MTVEFFVAALAGLVVVLLAGRLVWHRRRQAAVQAMTVAETYEARVAERLAAIRAARSAERSDKPTGAESPASITPEIRARSSPMARPAGEPGLVTDPRRRLWRDTSVVLLVGGFVALVVSGPWNGAPTGAVLEATGRPRPTQVASSTIYAPPPTAQPSPARPAVQSASPALAGPAGSPDPCAGCKTYVVQSGDTLGRVARRFGVSLDALLAVNPGIADPNFILRGDTILIPPSPNR